MYRSLAYASIFALVAGAAAPAVAASDAAKSDKMSSESSSVTKSEGAAATTSGDDKSKIFAPEVQAARPLTSDPTIGAEDLAGLDVRNMEGEELGEVADVVKTAKDNRNYLVVSHGGFLGVADKEIAVPFERAKLGTTNDLIYVDMSVAQVEAAPMFDAGDRKWANDESWLERNLGIFSDSDETAPKN